MYKISQFSKISGLTVKALRYYDGEGILTPSFRDVQNQYRYYSEEDLNKARLIKHLRSLDFTVMEIREAMDIVENEDDLAAVLREKISFIEKNIAKEKDLIQAINTSILSSYTDRTNSQYVIDTVDIGELFVASVRFTGKYSDLGNYIPLLYKAVRNHAAGRHFNCYYDDGYTENADIELCIPVKEEIFDQTVFCRKLPAVRALRTIHKGSYETLNMAYRALFEYANSEGVEVLTPSREVYTKSPGMIFKGNPDAYITEILLPFE